MPATVVAVAGAAIAGVCALAVIAGVGIAGTTGGLVPLPGALVPAADLAVLRDASGSCPELTPPRLAAQVMEATGFQADATTPNGGKGIAGLTDEQWKTWAPSEGAQRTDAAAGITALAHLMCDLAGQLRTRGYSADPWRLALAAFHSGLPAVTNASAVPQDGATTGYVNDVVAREAWYSQQPQLVGPLPAGSSSPAPSAPPTPVAGSPVPAADVAAVVAAAGRCHGLTPALVAGQLMALSGFRADLRGPAGKEGIAQLDEADWAAYAVPATASRSDPAVSIAALASKMCALMARFAGAHLGPDVYDLAVAAYAWSPDAVTLAGGIPPGSSVAAMVRATIGYAGSYARDPRLGGTPSSPGPSSPSRSSSPGASPTPGAAPAAIPNAYLPLVVAAGHACADLTPARVAAVLSVESRFDPAATRADGAQGIAMLSGAIWKVYAPNPAASRTDPAVEIPAAARYLCDLANQVQAANLSGDRFALAVASYRWGIDNVVAAKGSPPPGSDVAAYVSQILAAERGYATDRRLA